MKIYLILRKKSIVKEELFNSCYISHSF